MSEFDEGFLIGVAAAVLACWRWIRAGWNADKEADRE